jgi:DNA-binding NarL/FixJ family response regulator
VSKRVLIVDDNAVIRKGVMAIFATDRNFEICGEAANGQDAIEKAKSLKPDLIVLDFSMPVMNGIEAARVLTLIMPDVPLILLTMHFGKIVEVDAQKAGFRAIFSKDQNLELLVTRARALVGLPSVRTKSKGN